MSDQQTGPTDPNENKNATETPHFPSAEELGLDKRAVDFGEVGARHAFNEGLLSGTAPDSLGDPHTAFPPAPGSLTPDYVPMETLPKKSHKTRNRITAAIAGGVLLVTGGLGANKIWGNNDEASPKPTATGPAVAGSSASPEQSTGNPTTSETPKDPQESLGNEAKNKLEKRKAELAPFWNKSISSTDLAPMLAPEDIRKSMATEYGFDYTSAEILPISIMPNYTELIDGNNVERLTEVRTELEAAFDDGSIAKAIEISNREQGTNFTIDQFLIKKSDVPAANASRQEQAAFLKKIITITYNFRAIAGAMRIGEFKGENTNDADGIPLSVRLIKWSHLFGSDQQVVMRVTNGIPQDYKPDSVVSSPSLTYNIGGASGGLLIATAKDGLDQATVPVVGMLTTSKITYGSEDGITVTRDQQNEEIVFEALLPLTGKTTEGSFMPVYLGAHSLGIVR